MYFYDLSAKEQIYAVKKEFSNLIKLLFYDPSKIKGYVNNGLISKEQSLSLLNELESLNESKCVCCRKIVSEIKEPISQGLDILIDIARESAKGKYF